MAEERGNEASAVMLEEDAARALVRQGREAGFLTHEEIGAALDELGADPDAVFLLAGPARAVNPGHPDGRPSTRLHSFD